MQISCPHSRLIIWPHETGLAVPSGASLLILHTQAESGAYLRDSSRVPRRRPFIYVNRHTPSVSVPSLSGDAIAYQWRSLPRVRRHRTSKTQGSSERGLPWQVTMNQLICASLSHTHFTIIGIKCVETCDTESVGGVMHSLQKRQKQYVLKTPYRRQNPASAQVCYLSDRPSVLNRSMFYTWTLMRRTSSCHIPILILRYKPQQP